MDDRGRKIEDELGDNVLIVGAETETPTEQAEQ